MKKKTARWAVALLLVWALLALSLATAFAAEEGTLYEGTLEKKTGQALATVRYYLGDENDYQFAVWSETEEGYRYHFTAPEGEYTVVPEYYSTEVWDGAVDLSWYDPAKTEFELENGAQLAGLAAIISGSVDSHTPDYRIRGDRGLLQYTVIENYELIGAGGGNETATVYMGLAKNDFSGKIIHLAKDIDMGGKTDVTNWTPIGGTYPMEVSDLTGDVHITISYFNGVLDGRGHRILNLYCDRSNTAHFSHSQGIGLVGNMGTLYEGEAAPAQAPAVRNLSVAGEIHGRRSVGGIVGRIGNGVPAVYVENCANFATVTAHDAKGCGGIVGAGWAAGGAIVNCYNAGEISNRDYQCPTGGICGNNQNMNIYNCYNVGTIYAAGERGRAIGGHDGGSYIVSDCYYLEGCDNDPGSNGWYTGGDAGVTANCTALSEEKMKQQELVNLLNNNGSAYVYRAGEYPQLFWEADRTLLDQTCTVTIQKPTGGAITTEPAGQELPMGTVVRLGNVPETGWAFREYTFNGAKTTGDFFTLMEATQVSGGFESMRAGVLRITENPACEITVTKNGTAMVDGVLTQVENWPVHAGDQLYENDVLTATAVWREGAYPEDPSLVYLGMVDPTSKNNYKYAFTYTGGTEKNTTVNTHTVTSAITQQGISLTLTVEAQTRNKNWGDVADTSWYSADASEYTLTNARQLAGLIRLSKQQGVTFAGKIIHLGNDISLKNDDGTAGIRLWDGIGKSDCRFAGIFDGAGYGIYDMTAVNNTGSYVGLFCYCQGAEIKDLTVSGTAMGQSCISGICADATATTIKNCVSHVNVTDTGYGSTGGIIGAVHEGCQIENCINYGNITAPDKFGGIVGVITGNDCTVTGCINYGNVQANRTATNGVGGIAGRAESACTISYCANYGEVTGKQCLGGVIGSAVGTSGKAMTVSHCYNAGTIRNTATSASAITGGVAGVFNYCAMDHCFNYGIIETEESSTSSYIGALVGRHYGRSQAKLEKNSWLEGSCAWAVHGAESRDGAEKLTAVDFTKEDLLTALNEAGEAFALTNGRYPELLAAVGTAHTHTGGTATCCRQAICTGCHMPYGEPDPKNHEGDRELKNQVAPVWTTDGYSGDEVCTGCGEIVKQGSVIPADKDSIILSVYEQSGTGEAKLLKSYSRSDINALFAVDDRGVQGYQYWKDGIETLVAVREYVTLEALLKDAGISFAAGDTLLPDAAACVTWETMQEKSWFFHTAEEKFAVPVCLAFCYEIGTSGTVEEIAQNAKYADAFRLCYGASEYGAEAGYRLTTGIKAITVVHPEKQGLALGDLNGDGIIDIIDAGILVQFCNDMRDLSPEQRLAADINGDGEIDIIDAGILVQFCNDIIKTLRP